MLLVSPAGCTSNNVSSSTLSGSTSSLSSLTSEGTSGKSTSHSSSSLTQVPSPSHSPKAAGLKKRRRHKHIPIQYHYIISPDVETVQPPTKQELALKAILDECQVAVECVPNYHSNLDGYSCWDSSPSDTQTSWMGSDSGGVLECPGAVTTPSPYTEANYNSHLYTFPTTSPQYTMFGDGVHGGLLPCNQMEGEFPQQLHHNGVPPHCESVPHCYSASVYATSWPVAPPHSEYQCWAWDYPFFLSALANLLKMSLHTCLYVYIALSHFEHLLSRSLNGFLYLEYHHR